MSTSARPDNQQHSLSSDEDVVFVAHMATVRRAMRVYGVVGTRAVYRTRGAVPIRSVRRGHRARPILGTWGPVRGAAIGYVGGRPLDRRLGGTSVIHLGCGAKRPRSPSSSDEDVFCLGQVATGTCKFIPRCVF